MVGKLSKTEWIKLIIKQSIEESKADFQQLRTLFEQDFYLNFGLDFWAITNLIKHSLKIVLIRIKAPHTPKK